MPGINFYEFIILVVLALVLLGPERLPQYVQNLKRWARRARTMAEDAKVRFREETGADFDDVDWQKYDPRQYDPRRIIREALAEDYEDVRSTAQSLQKSVDPRELFAFSGSAGDSSAAGSSAADSSSAPSGTAQRSALAAGVAGSVAGAADTDDSDEDALLSAPAPFDADAT